MNTFSRAATLRNSLMMSAVFALAGCLDHSGATDATLASDSSAAAATQSVTQSTNATPTISGAPAVSAIAQQAYSFTPVAADANGNALTFSIQGKPSWATFNAATGQLYGTPAASDIGSNANVVISVSDGQAVSVLAFAITVKDASSSPAEVSVGGSALLGWSAPVTNADGSNLTDLAGYHVYYGKDPSNLSAVANVVGGANVQFEATSLSSGTWYFTIVAYNTVGVESAKPALVSTTI